MEGWDEERVWAERERDGVKEICLGNKDSFMPGKEE